MQVPGYTIEDVIHRGRNTLVYRGVREDDKKPVVFKSLRPETFSKTTAARLKHEFELLNGLNEVHINKSVCFHADQDIPVLVCDYDESFICLNTWIQSVENVVIEDFILIALEVVDALGEVHDEGILYKDLKPSNILINPKTLAIKLIDFSIATKSLTEPASIEALQDLDGGFAYISPEQTGRMNREVDYRTDYYSLGIILYEMLTGTTPFSAHDSMGWIYAHIASTPNAPNIVDDWIPLQLSNIIMKLLSKDAANRYQSAHGLKADLQGCLKQLSATGSIEPFTLGLHERKGTFIIPQTLYGREEEILSLVNGFTQCATSTPQLYLVSGPSGIGKSLLIDEVYKSVFTKRGTFVKGRYYQLRKNEPFLGITQALNGWVDQVLQLPIDEINVWKDDIKSVLGNSAHLLFGLITDLPLLLELDEEVSISDPSIAKLSKGAVFNKLNNKLNNNDNLFNHTFLELLNTIATEQRPLVLVLDDMQWADTPSFDLLEKILTDSKLKNIVVIATYRDNEVLTGHPLLTMLKELRSDGFNDINTLSLATLKFDDIAALLSDSLNQPAEDLLELADVVLDMTTGNPFFIKEYLHVLYRKKLLKFNPDSECWIWDASKIKHEALTTNLIDLLIAKLDELPEETISLIKVAACIGNDFDLRHISILSGRSLSEVSIQLWEAVLKGLIKPLSDHHQISKGIDISEGDSSSSRSVNDAFVHAKVHEAAYSLLPHNDKLLKHLAIGRMLLREESNSDSPNNLFAIVSHLNIARSCVASDAEKINLISLNLRSARAALESTAVEAAEDYLKVCLELLPSNAIIEHYELYLEVHVELIKCAYLGRQFEELINYAMIVKRCAQTSIEKMVAYQYTIKTYYEIAEFSKAWAETLEGAALLGVDMDQSPSPARLVPCMMRYRKLRKIDQASLEALPLATDPSMIAASELISDALTAAYFYDKTAFALLAFKSVDLSLRYGRTKYTPSGFAIVGYVGLLLLKDYRWGARLAKESLKTAEANVDYYQETLGPIQAKHLIFVAHMQDGVEEYRRLANQAYKNCLNDGQADFVTVAILSLIQFTRSRFTLPMQSQTLEDYLVLAHRYKNKLVLSSLQLFGQYLQNLAGNSQNFSDLNGDICNSYELYENAKAEDIKIVMSAVHSHRGYLNYHARDCVLALREFEEASKLSSFTGIYDLGVRLNYYMAVCKMANLKYDLGSTFNRSRIRLELVTHFKMVKLSVRHNFNNQHLYLVLEALKAALFGEHIKAMEYFDQSIVKAKEFDITIDLVDVLRHTVDFYKGIGRPKIAGIYLQEALQAIKKMGAVGLENIVLEQHADLLSLMASNDLHAPLPIEKSESFTGAIPQSSLDINEIRKASNALSGDVHLPSLLKKLLHLCMESSGAQRGALIIPATSNTDLYVQAIGDETTGIFNTLQHAPLSAAKDLPIRIIEYVARSKKAVVLAHAAKDQQHCEDPYIKSRQVKSLLCGPMLLQGRLRAIIYMENNLNANVFTDDRLGTLELLSTQASISIENATLFERLECTNKQIAGLLQATQDMSKTSSREQASAVAAEYLCAMDDRLDLKHAYLYINTDDGLGSRRRVYPASSSQRIAPADPGHYCSQTKRDQSSAEYTAINESVARALQAKSEPVFKDNRLYVPVMSNQVLHAVLELSEYSVEQLPTDQNRLDAYTGVTQSLALTLENIAAEEAKNQYIQESDRLKHEFIATISHELRTPLNGIQGSVELMKMDRSQQDYQSNLLTIEQSVHHMTGLVTSIIDFVAVEAGGLEVKVTTEDLVAKLSTLVDESREICAQKGVVLGFTSTIQNTHIEGDSYKIAQVCGYLLSNAVKFTSTGAINVDVTLTTNSAGHDALQITITDTGIGISDAVKNDIFTLFKQGDGSFSRQFGGLGIGLTLAKRMAVLLLGDIQFKSVDGEGSVFQAILPVIAIQQNAVAEEITQVDSAVDDYGSANESDAKKPVVLVVEDNQVNQKVLNRMLAKLNCEVATCDDGQQAVRWCENNTATLIFMDCQMPVMDGFEATRQIRAGNSDNRHIPIIAVTANVTEQDKENCFDAGMNDFLSKPIRKAIIEKALSEWSSKPLQKSV